MLNLERMIRFVEGLGVHQVNFHDLFKVGSRWIPGRGTSRPVRRTGCRSTRSSRPRFRSGAVRHQGPATPVLRHEDGVRPEAGLLRLLPGQARRAGHGPPERHDPDLLESHLHGLRGGDLGEGRIGWERSHANELAGHDLDRMTRAPTAAVTGSTASSSGLLLVQAGSGRYVWNHRLAWDASTPGLAEAAHHEGGIREGPPRRETLVEAGISRRSSRARPRS